MVTDEQVRLLMSLLSKGISQVTAAAKAGMSERTARKYVRSGLMPSAVKAPRTWRTRSDPFAVRDLRQPSFGVYTACPAQRRPFLLCAIRPEPSRCTG